MLCGMDKNKHTLAFAGISVIHNATIGTVGRLVRLIFGMDMVVVVRTDCPGELLETLF